MKETLKLKELVDMLAGRGKGIAVAVILLVLVLLPLAMSSSPYFLHLLFSVFIFATFGHAWNLMAGYAGLLTFGQQVFIGLGGFAQAIVFYYLHVPVWLAWPVAGIAAALFAWLLCLPLRERSRKRNIKIGVAVAVVLWLLYEWLIAVAPGADVFGNDYIRRVSILLLIFLGALPLLRLQGAYFAIATWLIAEAVLLVFNGWMVVGAGGGMQIKSGVSTSQLYYAALALLVVSTAVIWRWMRSSYGLALTAVRDDEDAARSSGVDVNKIKSAVFLVSAALTGLASGLYFMDVVIITPPSAFSISWAVVLVFVVVAGGMGTVAGPLIGAVLYIVVERVVGAAAGHGQLLLGVLSIFLMLVIPRGVMGVIKDLKQPARRRRGSQWVRWRGWLMGNDPKGMREALADRPGIVAAYMLPASPLVLLGKDQPAYAELRKAHERVARELEDIAPDTLVVYSTRWYAVLDQLWQGRSHMAGLHVDENWHELGEMRYDLITDVSMARACVRTARRLGIASKLVDYDGFPIDSATVAANALVNPQGLIPNVIVANNLYHDFEQTRILGGIVAEEAENQGKRVAVLVLGGLSGSEFRDDRPLEQDAIASSVEDDWNRRMLKLVEGRDIDALLRELPSFIAQARGDMGLKHLAFALGALGGRLGAAKVYAYGSLYGSGAAVARLF